MKSIKYIILIGFLVAFNNRNVAQSEAIPAEAIQSFQEEFNANKDLMAVNWTTENGLYVVTFEQNEEKHLVCYSDQGVKLFDKLELSDKLLNINVRNYIKKNFKKKQIIDLYDVSSNAAPTHNEVVILENGKKYLLIFTPEGKFHFKKEL